MLTAILMEYYKGDTTMNWSKEWPKNNVWLGGSPSGSKTDPLPKEPFINKGQYGKFNTELTAWPVAEVQPPNGVKQSWPTPNPVTDPVAFVEALGEKLGWPSMETYQKEYEQVMNKIALTGTGVVLTTIENGSIVQKIVDPSVYHNEEPTHDPYSNPNARIYYECNCGAILDPCTKSFAALNNAASEAGWKVRWNHDGYQSYCVECGKDVE